MAKTLNQFLEGYLKVKNPDEQKFVDKHVTAKHPDRNGNGDEVFNGSKVKTIDRRKDRHGYNPGEDEKVYEETEVEEAVRVKLTKGWGDGGKSMKAGYGKLVGNQHKIDANKNGKVDAHDFKLLRKKKKVAEEAEQIEEVNVNQIKKDLDSGMSHDAVIGKHANKRTTNTDAIRKVIKQHAWDKRMKKEEVEQIDELSTPTLQSYRKKARAQGNAIVDKMKMGGGDWSKDQKDTKTLRKRSAGANMSGKQLVKRGESLKTEEVELDELSRDTLRRYRMKAKRIGDNEKGDIGYRSKGRELAGRKTHGGQYGIPKAKVMASEEAKLEEKINMDKASMGTVIKDFQKSDAPQFKGKSQDKRRAMAIAAKLTAERGGKPLNKEEKLADLLGDLTESHKRTMLAVFDKLNESNQKKFLEACVTPEGVEQMLDFSISHRGE